MLQKKKADEDAKLAEAAAKKKAEAEAGGIRGLPNLILRVSGGVAVGLPTRNNTYMASPPCTGV